MTEKGNRFTWFKATVIFWKKSRTKGIELLIIPDAFKYEHIDWTKSQELVFESLRAGQRDYFFNVKLETATNQLYVKLREKTHRTGRSSSVFLGLSDLDQFTESCTMAFDVSPKPDPYTQV